MGVKTQIPIYLEALIRINKEFSQDPESFCSSWLPWHQSTGNNINYPSWEVKYTSTRVIDKWDSTQNDRNGWNIQNELPKEIHPPQFEHFTSNLLNLASILNIEAFWLITANDTQGFLEIKSRLLLNDTNYN